LLFVVGEERDSLGAKMANEFAASQSAHGCKYLVNGEPTENRIALASKGTLRAEVTASGRMAHSAYPEVGACTLNIGLIEGGRAPNVIPDYAHADLLYRLIGPSQDLRRQILATAGDSVKVEFPLDLAF